VRNDAAARDDRRLRQGLPQRGWGRAAAQAKRGEAHAARLPQYSVAWSRRRCKRSRWELEPSLKLSRRQRRAVQARDAAGRARRRASLKRAAHELDASYARRFQNWGQPFAPADAARARARFNTDVV